MGIRKHTNDINGLVSNMNLIYLDLTDISIKNRITRITNKIKKKLKPDAEETENSDMTNNDDSDSSQQSQKSPYNFNTMPLSLNTVELRWFLHSFGTITTAYLQFLTRFPLFTRN
ncbi:hypothetical protein JTB14_004792 [Gonioctena quinquepunctata]|nr:hypothetical protein JTB14_004792 [Gonioctena quinquepunctata]